MSVRAASVWLVILSLAGCTTALRAQPFTFTRLVDSNTTIPDSGGAKFRATSAFGPVTLSGERIAISGAGPGILGVFEWNAGVLVRVADKSTPVPQAAGTFVGVGGGVNSGERIVFSGNNGSFGGLYQRSGGVLSRIADEQMTAPNGGKYYTVGPASVEGDSIAFSGRHYVGQSNFPAVYRWDSGTIATVADTTTAVPGGTGNFQDLWYNTVRLDHGAAWFVGLDAANKTGIYRRNGDGLQAVLDTNSDGPTGMGKFTGLVEFDADGNDVLLRGATEIGNPTKGGLFTRINGQVAKLLSTGDPAPGGGNFQTLTSLSLGNGVAVFYDSEGGIGGRVYTNFGGTLQRIVGFGDIIDGKQVRRAYFNADGRDGNRLAMAIEFTDHDPAHGQFDQAVYLVTLPAPGALLPFVGGAILAMRSRR